MIKPDEYVAVRAEAFQAYRFTGHPGPLVYQSSQGGG